jgi:hypothetical protein
MSILQMSLIGPDLLWVIAASKGEADVVRRHAEVGDGHEVVGSDPG